MLRYIYNRTLFVMRITLVLIAALLSLPLIGQIEEEIGFKYMKAKYLIETERYEDAISAFSDIIRENPYYEEALLMRADAKYHMAAYKGTKNDVVDFISENGITPEAVKLLGMSDFKMGNYESALNSLETANILLPDDAKIAEYLGDSYFELNKKERACEAWQSAVILGSSNANLQLQRNCGGIANTKPRNGGIKVPDMKEEKSVPSRKRDDIDLSREKYGKIGKPGDVISNDRKSNDVPATKKEDNTTKTSSYGDLPPDDDFENVVEVDSDLSIIIFGQGIGRRKILSQPNILILSDSDGKVAVDFCVNNRGKVTSAEYNTGMSSIKKEHLVSLALRKVKEFWFQKNDYKEQCGTMIFDIKGM